MLLSALALLACTGTKNDSTTGDSQAADSGTTDTDTNSGDSGMGDTAATPAACPSRKPHDIPGAHWEDMYAGPAIVDYDVVAATDFNGMTVYPSHATQSGESTGVPWSDDTAWMHACDTDGAKLYGDIELYTNDGLTDSYTVIYDPPELYWPADAAVGSTWHTDGTGTWSEDASDGTHTDFGAFAEPEDWEIVADNVAKSVPAGDYTTLEVHHTGIYNDTTYDAEEFVADGVGAVHSDDNATASTNYDLTACSGVPGCP